MTTTLQRQQISEPQPQSEMGRKLCETFPYLWQAILSPNETPAQWQTITKYPLRPRVLWRYWQDPAQLVGVRFDHTTRYGMLDIDRHSPYHPAQDTTALPLIRTALETIGIARSLLIRSSFSGGLHLYLPLPEAVPTFGLALALKQCLEAQGFVVAQGKLEIFPNCKAYAKPGTYIEYNAHRLPLQPASGSCLLDADGNPHSEDLEPFFQQWDTASAGQDMEELQHAIATARTNRKARSYRKTIVTEWQQDLKDEIQEGWTGHGQTNHLLKTIACYGVVFAALEGDALTDYVERTAIASPGYTQWCQHQHEIRLRSQVWARAAENYYWKIGDMPKRSGNFPVEASNNIIPFNTAKSEDARNRIREVVQRLDALGTLPETITARVNAIVAQGISSKTLYRHLDLWHPEHLFQDQSKIPGCETVSAISRLDSDLSDDPPNPPEDKEFYTLDDFMKGKALTGCFSLSPSSNSDQHPPRLAVTESVTLFPDENSLQPPLIETLGNLTGTSPGFPQVNATPRQG
ncbi:MAG: hypothetical protein NW224_16475 [Leptolyngbyaceae cyanobacterium bins.302]|nr:hypothetical protein [Leptolyngbyaceae cyanobacterium bins.302]